ncbi:MAG: RNA polymerase sigma factor [Christensenellaceae bacterium]
MQELTREIDFLLSVALRKCENKEDAQDLTQETLLSALLYTAKGNKIDDLRGWLLTVMNRKFYDMLRKKYKQPLVSIGENFDIFDIIDECTFCEDINVSDEEEKIRREIAFLTSLYREVAVRFYMNDQSVQLIAQVLGIPEGTVKSRLSTARNQIKKGFKNMESYTENSYKPIKLHIANSGNASIYDEPRSLVENDLIAQNLLFLAYEQPITEIELSKGAVKKVLRNKGRLRLDSHSLRFFSEVSYSG